MIQMKVSSVIVHHSGDNVLRCLVPGFRPVEYYWTDDRRYEFLKAAEISLPKDLTSGEVRCVDATNATFEVFEEYGVR